MDTNRRFLLAVALSILVFLGVQYLFPAPQRPTPAATLRATPATPAVAATTPGTPGLPALPPTAAGATVGAAPVTAAQPAAPVETTLVTGTRAAYAVSSQGAQLVGAEMLRFRNLREVPKLRGAQTGDNAPREAPLVQFARPGESLLAYRLVVAGDTVPLARTVFRRAPTGVMPANGATRQEIRLDGTATTRAGAALPVAITYSFVPDSFTMRVRADVQGVAGPAFLLVDLPPSFTVTERDTADFFNHLAYTWKSDHGSAGSKMFAKLDPGERQLVPGPIDWAVAKSKYFLLGVLAPRGTGDQTVAQPFSELSLVGGSRTTKVAERAQATLVVPMAAAATAGAGLSTAFDVYAGPQEWRRLAAQGRAFEESNPYGGWLQGVVQPFATLAIRVILWMHDAIKLSYGWVLVVLGVGIRLVLWPLQQNMMRNQIKMQRVQPEIQAVQTKYKGDAQRLQQEMVKVYATHGMTPFAPITGCLPMLIPLPIFFALFFVFQNTIEFRGVPFLWLGDISLKDPFFALPVLVAATQFLISWIGMRGLPANPQTQMMGYIAPAMFLFFFLNVAAGLNLYYLTQNLVMLPQQWLLSKERAKAGLGGGGATVAGTTSKAVVQGTPVRKSKTA